MLYTIINAIFKDQEGYISRKLCAAWILTALASLMIVFGHTGSEDFTQFLSIIWATYFAADMGGNVAHAIKSKLSGTEEPPREP